MRLSLRLFTKGERMGRIFVLFLAIFGSLDLFGVPNSVGIGIISSTSYYHQEKQNSPQVIPTLMYESKDFYVKGIEIGYKYNKNLFAYLRPELREVEIDTLTKRARTLLGGVGVTHSWGSYTLELKNGYEILGKYDGLISQVKLSKMIVQYPFITIPSIGIGYESKKSTQYYYGVSQKEEGIYRSYLPKEAWNPFVGVVAIYDFHPQYGVALVLNHTFFDTTIKQSPIVDRDYKTTAIVNFSYKF